MKNRNLFLIFIILVTGVTVIGCKKIDDSSYFNGELTTIDKFNKEMTLKGTKVHLDGIFDGRPFVCDSFLVFNSSRFSDFFLYVFNLKNGKHITSLCPKGNGPDDFLSCDESVQIIEESGNKKIWVRDYNKQLIHCVNITRSIIEQKTVCDSIIPFQWSNHFEFPLLSVFFLNNGEILGVNQCEKRYSTGDGYTPRKLYLFKNSFDNKIKEYNLYKRPVICKDKRVELEHFEFYNAVYRIKPDNTQLAVAMKMLGQISIVDVKTGGQKNYRIDKNLSFLDIEEDIYKCRRYYGTMAVSDRYIFALYIDVAMKDVSPPYISNVIHVLSWDGEPVCKIHLDRPVREMGIDASNNVLYIADLEENFYAYDISGIQ